MDEIKIAELLPGYVKVEENNKNPVYKGHIQPAFDDTPLLAYFKIIPPREVLVESVCSLLCGHLGLPTPTPYLLIMSEKVCPKDGKHTIPAFATVDMKTPSFKHYLWQNSSNNGFLKKWPELIPAATFDEFIGNTDRNSGNLLFDGKSFSLIDHGLAIKETQRPDKPNIENHLFNIVKIEDELSKARHKRAALTKLSAYGEIPFNILATKTLATDYIDDNNINNVVDFLRERIDFMSDHIAYQLGMENNQRAIR